MATRSLTTMLLSAALVAAGAACSDTRDGLYPVGANEPSALEQERFVKRLHLDLTGLQPTDEELTSAMKRLRKEGDGPKIRASLANELLAKPTFAELYVSELENDVFSGTPANQVFDLFCGVFRSIEPACDKCPIDPAKICDCDCPIVSTLGAERSSLSTSAVDLGAGATTSEIARRYAATQIFRFNAGSPEGIAQALFETYLGRPAEPDEVKNVRALSIGTFVPGSPVGMLFHELGEDYDNLVDIVFRSEVYREAAVRATFLRYLGRDPSGIELRAFVQGLDETSPDVRPVIGAVVSSAEYYGQ